MHSWGAGKVQNPIIFFFGGVRDESTKLRY